MAHADNSVYFYAVLDSAQKCAPLHGKRKALRPRAIVRIKSATSPERSITKTVASLRFLSTGQTFDSHLACEER